MVQVPTITTTTTTAHLVFTDKVILLLPFVETFHWNVSTALCTDVPLERLYAERLYDGCGHDIAYSKVIL